MAEQYEILPGFYPVGEHFRGPAGPAGPAGATGAPGLALHQIASVHHDVTSTAPVDGSTLVYDANVSKWRVNTTNNVMIGADTAEPTSTYSRNVLIGDTVATNSTTSSSLISSDANVLIGSSIATAELKFNFNVLIGRLNGATVTGESNVAIGNAAGVSISAYDVAIGAGAGASMASGNNIAVGHGAGRLQVYGCVAIGWGSGVTQGSILNSIHQSNVAIGTDSGVFQSGSNVAVGDNSGKVQGSFSGSAVGNVAVGSYSGAFQWSGCVAVGKSSGLHQTTDCIAVGTSSGAAQGANCIAIGKYAGASQGVDAIAIGELAGALQGIDAIAIGERAGALQGINSIAIGTSSGATVGDDGIAIGTNAGFNTTFGGLAIGAFTGRPTHVATGCVVIGRRSLTSGSLSDNQYAGGAVCIGDNCGTRVGANAVIIGTIGDATTIDSEVIALGSRTLSSTIGVGVGHGCVVLGRDAMTHCVTDSTVAAVPIDSVSGVIAIGNGTARNIAPVTSGATRSLNSGVFIGNYAGADLTTGFTFKPQGRYDTVLNSSGRAVSVEGDSNIIVRSGGLTALSFASSMNSSIVLFAKDPASPPLTGVTGGGLFINPIREVTATATTATIKLPTGYALGDLRALFHHPASGEIISATMV